jgi:conjugative transfer signal peptidase TraF
MRHRVLMLSAAALLLMATPSVVRLPVKLIWNASPSVPIGLYGLRPVEDIHVGDLVAVTPPEPLARFLAQRGSLPEGVLLLKHVAALPGQKICREGLTVSVDGVPVGTARHADPSGQPLPVWQGCHRLRIGEVFLLNAGVPDSLDGRYFGVIPQQSILGLAVPLWTQSGPVPRRDDAPDPAGSGTDPFLPASPQE